MDDHEEDLEAHAWADYREAGEGRGAARWGHECGPTPPTTPTPSIMKSLFI